MRTTIEFLRDLLERSVQKNGGEKMSESTVTRPGITRRSFLKVTGAVAGVAAVAGGTSSLVAFADGEASNSSRADMLPMLLMASWSS